MAAIAKKNVDELVRQPTDLRDNGSATVQPQLSNRDCWDKFENTSGLFFNHTDLTCRSSTTYIAVQDGNAQIQQP